MRPAEADRAPLFAVSRYNDGIRWGYSNDMDEPWFVTASAPKLD
jgi:hypothetical protein